MRYVKLGLLIALYSILVLSPTSLFNAQDAGAAAKIFRDYSKSVLLLIVKSSNGETIAQATGFVIESGKIITNKHVVDKGEVFVEAGVAKFLLTIDKLDIANDLALLSTSVELSVDPLRLSSILPAPGSTVYAISNPIGLEKSITTGVVSSIRGDRGKQLIQITAPISPGSSGGPLFNSDGEVIGVIVGTLESGQNINFAIASQHVTELLISERTRGFNFAETMHTLSRLSEALSVEQYSEERDSPYQKSYRNLCSAFSDAIASASGDKNSLISIAVFAENIFFNDFAITASKAANLISPTPEGLFILAKASESSALFAEKEEKIDLLNQAEEAIRSCLKSSKSPVDEQIFILAKVLEEKKLYSDSERYYLLALETNNKANSPWKKDQILRGLVRVSDALGKQAECLKWFEILSNTNEINQYDWSTQAHRLDSYGHYKAAGIHFIKAASYGKSAWKNWLHAAQSFWLDTSEKDAALSCARRAITEGSNINGSESELAVAHKIIAFILNERGVFLDALNHARESLALVSTDCWAYDAQAEALIGLRRFEEAINPCMQAIRLSDGKYSSMHFRLGSVYFDLGNWDLSKQSYEKASEINKADSASVYNVALCLTKLGFYHDAADWYDEVLRRAPNHPQKQDILYRIKTFRR